MMRPALYWRGLRVWLSLAAFVGAVFANEKAVSAVGSCGDGHSIETTSIHFAPNTIALAPAELKEISCVADSIRGDPKMSVKVRVHLDDLGSSSYEIAIAQKRLAEVRQILRTVGIPEARIRLEIATDNLNGVACTLDACQAESTFVDLVRQR
jgi:outer membrane protein OmpA-like peptidoglycan-associated protein